jgi:hypothetical protein
VKRFIAFAGVGLAALLVLLWYQTRANDASPSAATASPAVAIAERKARADESFRHAVATIQAQQAEVPAGKIDPRSDEFYVRFDRAVPRVVTAPAMQNCYHGGLSRQDRDASITIEFSDAIKNGEVTFADVRVERSTLTDKALEACFVREIANAHYHDDTLPDWRQDDEIVITPERILSKYSPKPDDD